MTIIQSQPSSEACINWFQRHFKHYPEYQVIICTSCRYAVIPNQIESHLQKWHGEQIRSKQRPLIKDYLGQLHDIAHEPHQVNYPDPSHEAIFELPVYLDCYRCSSEDEFGTQCPFVSRAIRTMQEHCKKSHCWRNVQGRGGNMRRASKQASNRMWTEGQACQQFFKQGAWKKCFAVQNTRNRQPLRPITWEQGKKRLGVKMKRMEEHREQKVIKAHAHRYIPNPWLERAGWSKHLDPVIEDQLAAWIAWPDDQEDEEEQALMLACQSTVRVIRETQVACDRSNVSLAVLEYINRRETGAKNNEKPFYANQMSKTMKKYCRHWVRILCYIWRTYRSEHRPPYELSAQQLQHLTHWQGIVRQRLPSRLEESGDEMDPGAHELAPNEEVDNAALAFWISMFDHDMTDVDYTNGVCSGLAVLGWDFQNHKWMTALWYTPILSAMVAIARMLVIYHARCRRRRAIQSLIDQGHSRGAAEQEAESMWIPFRDMVHRFMTLTAFGGHPTPMNFILRLRAYGLAIRYNTPQPGMIHWNQEEINCGKVHVRISELRGMVHGLVASVRRQLFAELLMLRFQVDGTQSADEVQLPRFDMDELRDNPTEKETDWYFTDDPRNVWPVDGKEWLYHRAYHEEGLRGEWIEEEGKEEDDDAESPLFRKSRVATYLRQVREFKERLLVLIQMTWGPPARATELLSIQYRNHVDSMGRGVLVREGMVEIVTGYHKGYGVSAKPKIIHRFPPKEVGELVIYYLWLVQPFVEIIQLFQQDQVERGSFMWEPQGFEEGDSDVEDADEEHTDSSIHETAYARIWGGGQSSQAAQEEQETARNHEPHQTKNRIITAEDQQPLNADGFWTGQRVRRVFVRETLSRMGERINIQIWRHIVAAIIREYSRDQRVQRVLDELEHVAEAEAVHDDMRDVAFGHGTHVAQTMYGRDVMESPFHTVQRREGFRRVSVEWHEFLQFPSAMGMASHHEQGQRYPPMEMRDDISRSQAQRWQKLRQVELEVQLHRFMNGASRFRGSQKAILQAVVRRQSPIVAIMGTGSGKSLLFMLPAFCEPRGLTVVVVPLVSLREDMVERCLQKGIRCQAWSSRQPPDGAQIVLVTPEGTTTEGFHHWINRERALGRLDRIVVDECHVILDSQQRWREKMRDLVELGRQETQLMYLTATLPPREEATWVKMMDLQRKEICWFREGTTRGNIRYQVREYAARDEEAAIRALVEEKKRQYAMPGQIIIYCGRVEQARRLAEVLGCLVYHRTVGATEAKAGILQALIEGKEQVFTATNALGLGIDRGSIRVVIHMGSPRGMRDYAQESGRAGRDGQVSECIIMQSRAGAARGVEAEMQRFVGGEECRRAVLDEVMDGRSRGQGCEEGEERCDVCMKRGQSEERGEGQSEEEKEGKKDKGGRSDEGLNKDSGQGLNGRTGEGLKRRKEEEEEREEGSNDSDEKELMIDSPKGPKRRRLRGMRGRQRRMEEGQLVEELEGWLEQWRDRCAVCAMLEKEDSGHGLEGCLEAESEGIRQAVQRMRQGIQYERYAGCFRCGLPQGICQRWQEAEGGAGSGYSQRRQGRCQYGRHVAAEVVTAVVELMSEREREGMRGRVAVEDGVDVSGFDEGRMMRWYGERVVVGGVEMSRLVQMFMRCVQWVEGKRKGGG